MRLVSSCLPASRPPAPRSVCCVACWASCSSLLSDSSSSNRRAVRIVVVDIFGLVVDARIVVFVSVVVVVVFVVFVVVVHDLGGFVIDEVVGDGAASEDESRRTDVDVTLHDGLEGAVA